MCEQMTVHVEIRSRKSAHRKHISPLMPDGFVRCTISSHIQVKYSALMRAALHGHSECVRLLVEGGADKGAKNYVRCVI